jgi:rubredoxin
MWADDCKFVPGRTGVATDKRARTVTLEWGGAPYEIDAERIRRPEDALWWLHHLGEKEWIGMDGPAVAALIEKLASLKGWALYADVISEHQAPPAKAEVSEERAKMTPAMRWDVIKRDGWRCRACGFSVQDGAHLHVDHIQPVSKGGKTTPGNLQTLCSVCNMGKRDQ